MVEFPHRHTVNKGLQAGGILGSLIDPVGAFFGLLIYGLGWMLIRFIDVGAESLAKDHRDDPVYRKNVQALIERNRQFEKKE